MRRRILKRQLLKPKLPEQKKAIKEEKNLAFKSSKSGKEARSSKDSDVSSDDEIALMTHGFPKFLKNNKRKTGNAWGNKKMFDGGDSHVVRCFRCNEKGHIKAECPLLKNEKNKGKEAEKPRRSFNRGMCATWGHSEEEISSSDEEMPKGICFMAHWRHSQGKTSSYLC